jgi:hypothetical protein
LPKKTSTLGLLVERTVNVYVESDTVAFAFAIEFPVQATTMRPPGTSMMLLLVDGLAVGDGELTLGVGEPVSVGVGVAPGETVVDADTEMDGVGVGGAPATTGPPTALPSRQVKTYSVPGGAAALVGVGDGTAFDEVAGVGGVTDADGFADAVWFATAGAVDARGGLGCPTGAVLAG